VRGPREQAFDDEEKAGDGGEELQHGHRRGNLARSFLATELAGFVTVWTFLPPQTTT
jgi:hypothetical protein